MGAAIVAAGILIGAQPAGAATSTPADADADLVTQFHELVVDGGPTGLIPGAGQIIEPQVLQTVDQIVDATGKLLRIDHSDAVASTDASALDSFPCVKDSGARLEIFPVVNRMVTVKNGVVHYQYHPYMLHRARYRGHSETNQVEVCSTGGGNLRGNSRIFQVGTGMAADDATQFLKIGQAWQSGSTPKDYSLSLGFQVAPKESPVSISASITQTPTDKLMGSIIGPFKSFMDRYARNAVNAWWQDACVDSWHGCHFSWNGSANFQGTIAQGLWEYPVSQMPSAIWFRFTPYLRSGCAHWYRSC